jgi:hypothetical protein
MLAITMLPALLVETPTSPANFGWRTEIEYGGLRGRAEFAMGWNGIRLLRASVVSLFECDRPGAEVRFDKYAMMDTNSRHAIRGRGESS